MHFLLCSVYSNCLIPPPKETRPIAGVFLTTQADLLSRCGYLGEIFLGFSLEHHWIFRQSSMYGSIGIWDMAYLIHLLLLGYFRHLPEVDKERAALSPCRHNELASRLGSRTDLMGYPFREQHPTFRDKVIGLRRVNVLICYNLGSRASRNAFQHHPSLPTIFEHY